VFLNNNAYGKEQLSENFMLRLLQGNLSLKFVSLRHVQPIAPI